MIIKSRFREGDLVYTLSNNKIKQGKIIKPYFDNYDSKLKTLEERLQWEVDIKEFSPFAFSLQYNIKRSEKDLFETKEELIKSL